MAEEERMVPRGRQYGKPEAKRIVKLLRQIEEGLDTNHIREVKDIVNQMISIANGERSTASGKSYDEKLHAFVNMVIFKAGISVTVVKQAVRGFFMIQRQPGLGNLVKKERSLAEMFPSLARMGNINDDTLQLYVKALETGKVEVKHIRLMVVGMFGVGKTTLVRKLCNKKTDDVKSTVVLDVSVNACEVDEDGHWIIKEGNTKEKKEFGEQLNEIMTEAAKESVPNKQVNTAPVQVRPTAVPTPQVSSQSSPPKPVRDIVASAKNVMNNFTEEKNPGIDNYRSGLKKVQQDVGKTKPIPRQTKRNTTVSIWDFAGQSVYYSTHHFFLSARSIYLLVLDISKQLGEKVSENKSGDESDQSNENIFLEGCMPEGFTSGDALRFWINSIYTYTKEMEEKEAKPDGWECMPEPYHPTIVLVGTHKDQLEGSENKKEQHKENYFREALEPFKDSPVRQMIHQEKFLVSCTKDLPDVFDKIKKKIYNIARKQPFWKETSPARWIPLERSIEEKKTKDHKCMPFEDLAKINTTTELPLEDKTEIQLFLQLQHFLGNLLYYNVGKLNHNVILKPVWIIDIFKLFVTHRNSTENQEFEDDWNTYRKKAILSPKLIHFMIDQSNKKKKHEPTDEDYLQYEDVVEYMKHLDVMAHPVIYKDEDKQDKQEEEFFIVPCVLKKMTPDEANKQKKYFQPNVEKKTPVLCFRFKNGFLPPAVFHRLIATCIREWEISKCDKDYLLYNGMGVFKLDSNRTLTLWYTEAVIFMRIAVYPDSCKLKAKDCGDIKKKITEMLNTILLLDRQKREKKAQPDGQDGTELFEECILCEKRLNERVEVLFKDPCTPGLLSVKELKDNSSIMCQCCDHHGIKSEEALSYWVMESAGLENKDSLKDIVAWFKDSARENLDGIPKESELSELAALIGDEYWDLGLHLGFTDARLQQIREGNLYDVRLRVYKILREWKSKHDNVPSYRILQQEITEAKKRQHNLKL